MNQIPHLCFHSVAPKKDSRWYRSFLTVDMQIFEELILYLKKLNYVFISMDEYVYHANNRMNIKFKPLCLSFDDGYLDNYVFVYPLLKKHNIKATIFVNPDYVQERREIRPTLEDVWENKCSIRELETLGFISWEELKRMQSSGIFDVQSHTMTHTKHFVSDKIIEFHNPRADYLYPIANAFPLRKAYYMTDPQFMYLLPFGTPFFEQKSSVVAKKITINQHFVDECVDILSQKGGNLNIFKEAFTPIERVYNSYIENNNLIREIETEREHVQRVISEIVDSKRIIEEKLQKAVSHCCWPHGIYNDFCHRTALEAGYKTTVIYYNPKSRVPDPTIVMRNGFVPVGKSILLTNLKTNFKLASSANVFPYNLFHKLFHTYKNNLKELRLSP